MQHRNIEQDAPVEASDGEFGRVRHVIIDPQTREVTNLVVAASGGGGQQGKEWLIPMSAVSEVTRDRVVLHGERAEFEHAPAFQREAFHAVDDETARDQTQERAVRGGAPLVDAKDDAVEIGTQPSVVSAAREPVLHQEGAQAQQFTRENPYRLQLKEERLRVGQREEQAGLIRISRRVVEREEIVRVPVREEWLIIERLPGDGSLMVGERELIEGERIELPLRREEIAIEKRAVLEDVRIRKEVFVRTQQIRETLRREELVVDDSQGLVVSRAEGKAEAQAAAVSSATVPEDVRQRSESGADYSNRERGVASAVGTAAVSRPVPAGSAADESRRAASGNAGIVAPEGARVVTTDGEYLGRVKEHAAGRFHVDAPMQPDYWLPNTCITDSSHGKVHVSFAKDDLKNAKLKGSQ
ncbi:MAG: DUF2382 domain-containing protein [Dehalococcoidia bacterium]